MLENKDHDDKEELEVDVNLSLEYLKAKRRVAQLARNNNKTNKSGKTYSIVKSSEGKSASSASNEKEEKSKQQQQPLDPSASSSSSSEFSRTHAIQAGLVKLGIEAPNSSISVLSNGILQEMQTELQHELQTAGLRKGSENALLSLINDLCDEQHQLSHDIFTAYDEWKLHAEECVLHATTKMSTLEQKLLLSDHGTLNAETKSQIAMEECAALMTELEVTRFECSAISEEAQRARNEAKEEFIRTKSSVIVSMQRQMEDIKGQMKQEQECAVRKAACAAQREKQKLEKEWQEKYTMLQLECERLRNNWNQLCQDRAKLEMELKTLKFEGKEEIDMRDEQLALLRNELYESRDSLRIEKEENNRLRKDIQTQVNRVEKQELELKITEQRAETAERLLRELDQWLVSGADKKAIE